MIIVVSELQQVVCVFLEFCTPPTLSSALFVVNVGKKHLGTSAATPAGSWRMQFVQLQNCRNEVWRVRQSRTRLFRTFPFGCAVRRNVLVTWLKQMEDGNYRWMLRRWKLLYCSTVSKRDVLFVRFWSDRRKKREKKKALPQSCGKTSKIRMCWWDVTRLGEKNKAETVQYYFEKNTSCVNKSVWGGGPGANGALDGMGIDAWCPSGGRIQFHLSCLQGQTHRRECLSSQRNKYTELKIEEWTVVLWKVTNSNNAKIRGGQTCWMALNLAYKYV